MTFSYSSGGAMSLTPIPAPPLPTPLSRKVHLWGIFFALPAEHKFKETDTEQLFCPQLVSYRNMIPTECIGFWRTAHSPLPLRYILPQYRVTEGVSGVCPRILYCFTVLTLQCFDKILK